MSAPINNFRCYSLNERAITVEFGNAISAAILDTVTEYNQLLNRSPFPGFITTTPAYTTLTVFYDPLITANSALPGKSCLEKVSNYLYNLSMQPVKNNIKTGITVTVPVCYGGAYGPDLAEVASLHQLSVDAVISLHSNAVYKVYVIGFLPGFAYLGGLDERLATPRKATPRKIVAAGSVGLAGLQTGIYPIQSPGGWQIIGRTPLCLFDIRNSPPALLKAGDNIIFKPISENEFKTLAG